MATAVHNGPLLKLPQPEDSEKENLYFGRIMLEILPESTDLQRRFGLLKHNSNLMLTTIQNLRSLQAEGKLTPQTFNENATIFNSVVNSRGEYTGNLQERVKCLSAELGTCISHFENLEKKFHKAIALKVAGERFNLSIQDRLTEVIKSQALLKERKEEADKMGLDLPKQLAEELEITKRVGARLNNNGASVNVIRKTVGYLASFVFKPYPLQTIALKEVPVDITENPAPQEQPAAVTVPSTTDTDATQEQLAAVTVPSTTDTDATQEQTGDPKEANDSDDELFHDTEGLKHKGPQSKKWNFNVTAPGVII